MAWVVAASSLFHSLNTLRPAEKAELDELVYAESGGQGDNSLARRIE